MKGAHLIERNALDAGRAWSRAGSDRFSGYRAPRSELLHQIAGAAVAPGDDLRELRSHDLEGAGAGQGRTQFILGEQLHGAVEAAGERFGGEVGAGMGFGADRIERAFEGETIEARCDP